MDVAVFLISRNRKEGLNHSTGKGVILALCSTMLFFQLKSLHGNTICLSAFLLSWRENYAHREKIRERQFSLKKNGAKNTTLPHTVMNSVSNPFMRLWLWIHM